MVSILEGKKMAEPRANGLPAFKQGLVNYSAQIDRKRARGRKSTVANSQVVPYRPNGDNEFDILTDEFALTQLYDPGTRFTEDEDLSRTPVLTTVAGIQLDPNDKNATNPQRLLSKVAFAGISQTRVDYKPEMAAYDAGEEDLAVQIAGVFHDTAVAEDFPFGHKIRLCLPLPESGDYYGNHSYVDDKNVGKARLIAKPEGDGNPFAQRMTEWIGAYAAGEDKDTANMTATELAFKEFYESLTDTMMIAYIYGAARNEEIANEQAEMHGLDARLAGRELTQDQVDARRELMQEFFVHMVGSNPVFSTKKVWTRDPNSVFNRMRMQHMLKTLAAFSDALRIDNQWVIGDVIRPSKEGRKYYGILK